MACDEHKELARFVKYVHKSLRVNARKVGATQAWKDHCQQKEMLKRYAETMHQLATEHWERSSREKVFSRIQWIVEQSVKYYLQGGQDVENQKEMKKIGNPEDLIIHKESTNELLLLDVGSCYNPFKKFPIFKVFPIDLNPACDDVFEADFLNLSVLPNLKMEDIVKELPIKLIPEQFFDIVVFSLLLEYMPSPHQRFLCCEKAYSVLKQGGLLCIITPDSKHPSANSSLMRKWRICLAYLGFTRIMYEKFPHIHCMVFRKNYHIVVPRKWAEGAMAKELMAPKSVCDANSTTCLCKLLKIPQDDTEYLTLDVKEQTVRTEEDTVSIIDMFQELPENFDLF